MIPKSHLRSRYHSKKAYLTFGDYSIRPMGKKKRRRKGKGKEKERKGNCIQRPTRLDPFQISIPALQEISSTLHFTQ